MKHLRSLLRLGGIGLLLSTAACGGGAAETAPTASAGMPEGVATEQRLIAEEIAAEGGETPVGPWRIAYVVEPAEPWFEDGEFREPAPGETHHIEILPIEAETGRVIPEVPITLEVVDESGEVVDAKDLELFYAEFFHYANNFSIPEDGAYTLRARIEPPTFRRHGEERDEAPLSEGAEVEFENVELVTE
jgi:hypothetical protein